MGGPPPLCCRGPFRTFTPPARFLWCSKGGLGEGRVGEKGRIWGGAGYLKKKAGIRDRLVMGFQPCPFPISSAAGRRPRARFSAFLGRNGGPGVVGPSLKCLPDGVPHADLLPEPFKIVHTPGLILMLYEV